MALEGHTIGNAPKGLSPAICSATAFMRPGCTEW